MTRWERPAAPTGGGAGPRTRLAVRPDPAGSGVAVAARADGGRWPRWADTAAGNSGGRVPPGARTVRAAGAGAADEEAADEGAAG